MATRTESDSMGQIEVDEAAVDEQLEGLRARFGTLKGVERGVENGDFVSIDLAATVDGEAVEEAEQPARAGPGDPVAELLLPLLEHRRPERRLDHQGVPRGHPGDALELLAQQRHGAGGVLLAGALDAVHEHDGELLVAHFASVSSS